jgi:hypothetical protein
MNQWFFNQKKQHLHIQKKIFIFDNHLQMT